MSEDKKMEVWQKAVIGLIALIAGGGGATQLMPNYEKDFDYLKEGMQRLEQKVNKNPQREDIVRLDIQLEQLKERIASIEAQNSR